MLGLEVLSGGGSRVVALPPAPAVLTLGSGSGAGVVVADPTVDPAHVAFALTPAGVRMSDCGSRTGTRLNGMLVSRALVRPGDEVRIGSATVRVVEHAPSADAGFASPPESIPLVAPLTAPSVRAPAAPPRRREPSAPRPRRKNGNGEARRAAAAAPRKKSHWKMVIVLLVAATGATIGGVLFGSEQARKARVRKAVVAYDQAAAAWKSGRIDAAEREFEAVISSWPDLAVADQAKLSLSELEAERTRERESRAARDELEAQWTQLTLVEFEKEYGEYRSTWQGTRAEQEPGFLAGIRERYRAEAERRFAEVRARADQLVDRDRYYDAVLVWHEYITVPQNIVPDIAAATDEGQKIQARAREAYETVRVEVEELIQAERLEEAVALLEERIPVFSGLRYAFDLRQKRELVAVLETGGTEAPPEAVAEQVTRRGEYLKLAEEAESLVKRRRYAEAVAAFERAAEASPREDQAAEEFRARARELAGLARLFAELRLQLESHPERFRSIDVGHGLKANAARADDDGLTVSIRGAESRLPWSRLGPERLLVVLERLKLEAPDRLYLARFALDAGDEDFAHGQITAALSKDESLSDRAFAMLARFRKIEVPAEGFVLYQRRWMTPDERDEAELRDAIAEAGRDARSSDRRRSEKGLATLRDLGAPAVSTLVAALSDLRKQTAEQVRSHPAVRDSAVKAVLHRELVERRKAALALIYDEAKYPYPHPDGPAYDAVQAEVDQLVEAVRVIWERPLARLLERNEELLELYSRVEGFSLELGSLGRDPEPSFEELVAGINAAVDMPRYAPGGTAKSALEWNDKVLAYNEEIDIGLDEEEKNCVRALNGYRMMMGRKAVKWNRELLEGARAHSKEMKSEGYFAHDCPLPGPEHDPHRSPSQRARIAGYGGGVSENIARGSTDGTATHWQWYRSSGHHRNLLQAGHTEVGVGREAEFWTQNFGRASKSLDLPRNRRGERPGGR